MCAAFRFHVVLTIALDTIDPGKTCKIFIQNWTCCYNQYLDETTSQCLECRDGSIGWNCNTTCHSGYYGRLCREHCGCEAHLCDAVSGCLHQNVTERSNKTSNESHDWLLGIFLFIGSLIIILIGGVLLYLRPVIKRLIISRGHSNQDAERESSTHTISTPNHSVTNVPTVTISSVDERSSNYDDIRYSNMMQYKQNFSELRSSSNGSAMKNPCKLICSRSVLYDNFMDYDGDDNSLLLRAKATFSGQTKDNLSEDDNNDYSRLLLRKKRSIFVDRNNILLEEGDYAYLQTKGTGRKHLDVTIRRSQSLSQGTGRLNPNFTIRRSQSLSRDTSTPHPDFTIRRSQSLSHGTGMPRPALNTPRSQSLSGVAGRPHPAFTFSWSNSLPRVSRNQREEALENYNLV